MYILYLIIYIYIYIFTYLFVTNWINLFVLLNMLVAVPYLFPSFHWDACLTYFWKQIQIKLVGGLEHEFYFPYIVKKSSQLTNIFQMGWNHQPGKKVEKPPFPYALCMVYLPTKLFHKIGVNVGKYSSTMEQGWVCWYLFPNIDCIPAGISLSFDMHTLQVDGLLPCHCDVPSLANRGLEG